MPLHGVFRAALNGMHARGDGGFVYVKGDECAYLFPSELRGHDDARETLGDMLTDEKAKMVIYVLEERDGQVHVLAYPRDRVLKDMIEDAPPLEEEVPDSVEDAIPTVEEVPLTEDVFSLEEVQQ